MLIIRNKSKPLILVLLLLFTLLFGFIFIITNNTYFNSYQLHTNNNNRFIVHYNTLLPIPSSHEGINKRVYYSDTAKNSINASDSQSNIMNVRNGNLNEITQRTKFGFLPHVKQWAMAIFEHDHGTDRHRHPTGSEIFFILEGTAIFEIEYNDIDDTDVHESISTQIIAQQFDTVFIPPNTYHIVRNDALDDLRMVYALIES